jgi:hypothetical protein
MLVKVKVFAGCIKDEILKKKDDGFEVMIKVKVEEGIIRSSGSGQSRLSLRYALLKESDFT